MITECPKGHRIYSTRLTNFFKCVSCKKTYPRKEMLLLDGSKGMSRKINHGFKEDLRGTITWQNTF